MRAFAVFIWTWPRSGWSGPSRWKLWSDAVLRCRRNTGAPTSARLVWRMRSRFFRTRPVEYTGQCPSSRAILVCFEARAAGCVDLRPAATIDIVRCAQAVEEQQPEKAAGREHPFQRGRSFQAHEQNEQYGGLDRRDAELHDRYPDAHAE